MIGFAHLSLNVIKFESACKELEKKGFICDFLEKSLPNPIEKKPILNQFERVHSIALFRNVNSNESIEITCHGNNKFQQRGPYEYSDDKIIVKTSNIIKEQVFWELAMNFKSTQKENQLEFKSIIPKWSCKLEFIEDKTQEPCYLDSQGHTCLAFLTKDIEADMKRMVINGAFDFCGPFILNVNKKELKIILARSIGGALIELIQI